MISRESREQQLPICTFVILALLIGLLVSTSSLTQEPSDEQIVRQFFPQRLLVESIEDFESGGPPPFEAFDFAIADLEGSGVAEFIVAAYTNGFSGAVRVLRKRNNSVFLVAEPDLPLLGGVFPKLELVDMDNDGRPEVIASFSSARGAAADWIFKWNLTTLDLIGPSSVDEEGNLSSVLSEADLVDLDGDGILEIVNPPQLGPLPRDEEELSIGGFEVFSLSEGRYTFLRSLDFFGTFIRNIKAPIVVTRNFPVTQSELAYSLRVINGDPDGGNRVSSAEIRLNGFVEVSPDRFNQQVSEIVVPVVLRASNTVSVELRGKPGGKIIVTVDSQSQ